MKWLKNRLDFLTEREKAKIGEVILPRQSKEIKSQWGEVYLDLEEIEPTDRIKQGKWKLSEEDKYAVLDVYFSLSQGDLKSLIDWFRDLPDKFIKLANESVEDFLKTTDINNKIFKSDFKDFDIKNVSLDQIYWLNETCFTKISVAETKASEYIVKDDNGIPIKDEDNQIVKKDKKPGDVIWSKSKINFTVFLEDYNKCFDKVDIPSHLTRVLSRLADLMTNIKSNSWGYEIKGPVFNKDMFLSIKHNPKDILNMSISKFYRSCQDLYSGELRDQLLANVFDPHSIPAFIVFDTPIYMNGDTKISDQLPVCRRIIRSILTGDEVIRSEKDSLIFFDRTYPDRLEDIMGSIIEKYTENKKSSKYINTYLFAPDLNDSRLQIPYMDRLGKAFGLTIGKNVKSIFIGPGSRWNYFVMPSNVNVEEISISTIELPKNLFETKIKTKKLTFKYLKLNDITDFSNLDFEEIYIEKCSLSADAIRGICSNKSSKITIIASEFEGEFGGFELDELSLLYTLKPQDLIKTLNGVNAKSIILSSDLNQSKENKNFINELKKKGIKIEMKGPKI
jgi:hypothetical protein